MEIAIPVAIVADLAVRFIDGAPDEDVSIHKLCAYREVSLVGAEVCIPVFRLDAIEALATFGDDIDDG